MTVPEFFGCAFLAFGPPAAMFILTIAQDPILVIIMFGSAFYWYVSLLTSSLLWLAFCPIPMPETLKLVISLMFSVVCQESFRFLLYKTLKKSQHELKRVTDENSQVSNRHILAYTSGLGFGIMSGTFALVNILADSVGPATMGLKMGDDNFFLVSATLTLSFILMHVFWSIIFSNAMHHGHRMEIAFVVISHLIASLSTLFSLANLHLVGILICYLIVIVTGSKAFISAGGSVRGLLRCLQCTNAH